MIKKVLFPLIFVVAIFFVAGCSDEYDDSALVNRVDGLEDRVARLEQMCNQMNTNITSLQSIVAALQNNDYITGVTAITEGGKTIGYTINFAKSSSITIYHGNDGKDGVDGVAPRLKIEDGYWYISYDNGLTWSKLGKATGEDGKDGITPLLRIEDGYWYISYDNGSTWTKLGKATGEDGSDGKDGYAPVIGVELDRDGVYYWTLDGEWLLDENGQKIKAVGKDGANGINGLDGITPLLKIENDYWFISYDNGSTWTMLGKATGENGKDGVNGEDGIDGDSFFRSVDVSNPSFVTFVLADGTTFVVPRSIMNIISQIKQIVYVPDYSDKKVRMSKVDGFNEGVAEFNFQVVPDSLAEIVANNWEMIASMKAVKTKVARSVDYIDLPIISFVADSLNGVITVNVSGENLSDAFFEGVEEASASLVLSDSTNTIATEFIGMVGVLDSIPDNQIWYRTLEGDIHEPYGDNPFDVNIVSNNYQNGIGIITCSGPIKKIKTSAFSAGASSGYDRDLTELYLPNSIEIIERAAIVYNDNLSIIKIPSNLKNNTRATPIYINENLERFIGTNTNISEDGRCVIIDGNLIAFAPKNIENYIIPDNVTKILDYTFSGCDKIQTIICPEGLEHIGVSAFSGCANLQSFTIPESVSKIDHYVFSGCINLEGFYGNEKFHTSDNKCFIVNRDYGSAFDNNGIYLEYCATKGLNEYIIPEEGIEYIENYAFCSSDLKSVTIPRSLINISSAAFVNCSNLETVYGEYTSSDNKCFVINGELKSVIARKGITPTYRIPDDVTSIVEDAFYEFRYLEKVIMGDQVTHLNGKNIFNNCASLREITLSANLKDIGPAISGYIETVYCRSIVPPKYSKDYMYPNMKNFYVPEISLHLYRRNEDLELFKNCFVGYKYNDLQYDDVYISSDFSADGTTETLQTATEGKGINIVLMGDGYSDRQIADGTYREDMEYACQSIFAEEPYKSFKHLFNVSYVNVVSATEGFDYITSLECEFGLGLDTHVSGNNNKCVEYAEKVVSDEQMNETMIVVVLNSDIYAGTCYMYYPENKNDYASGLSISYFPKGVDEIQFEQILQHEACGHGFAKLIDEYNYDGTIPSKEIDLLKSIRDYYGWYKNVDFTSDPMQVQWAKFLTDSRYMYDGLGVFEGACTYAYGAYRPTENSIMRYNTGGFNAPSREAIYYRIHKLAYGDSWQYDYEKFVEWDAINRATSPASAQTKSLSAKPPRNFKPLAPPVIIKKSWREVMKTK